MGKGLYYTDPLAAAYMAREFGIRIFVGDSKEYLSQGIGYNSIIYSSYDKKPCVLDMDKEEYRPFPPPFFVHPDDVAIFEPQAGDYVEIDIFYYSRQREPELYNQICLSPASVHPCGTQHLSIGTQGVSYQTIMPERGENFTIPYKIIMRNGKPFFMPEVEA